MTTTRYQVNQPTYMPLNGQWQIVLPGTVFDDDSRVSYHASTATPIAEPATSLAAHGKATSVRGVRTR